MRFIKKTVLVRAERVPTEDGQASMFQHDKIVRLLVSAGNFKVSDEKGYEIFLPDRKLVAHPGDWIVITSDGGIGVYTHDWFNHNFEPG